MDIQKAFHCTSYFVGFVCDNRQKKLEFEILIIYKKDQQH